MENNESETIEVSEPTSVGSDTPSTPTPLTGERKTHPEAKTGEKTLDAKREEGNQDPEKVFLAIRSDQNAAMYHDDNWVRLLTRLEDILRQTEFVMADVERYIDDPQRHEALMKCVVAIAGRLLSVLKFKPGEKVCLDLIEFTAPDKGKRARVNLTNHRFDPSKIMS